MGGPEGPSFFLWRRKMGGRWKHAHDFDPFFSLPLCARCEVPFWGRQGSPRSGSRKAQACIAVPMLRMLVRGTKSWDRDIEAAESDKQSGTEWAETPRNDWLEFGRTALGIGQQANAEMHQSLKVLSSFLLARTVPILGAGSIGAARALGRLDLPWLSQPSPLCPSCWITRPFTVIHPSD